jgi:hypothetical protein
VKYEQLSSWLRNHSYLLLRTTTRMVPQMHLRMPSSSDTRHTACCEDLLDLCDVRIDEMSECEMRSTARELARVCRVLFRGNLCSDAHKSWLLTYLQYSTVISALFNSRCWSSKPRITNTPLHFQFAVGQWPKHPASIITHQYNCFSFSIHVVLLCERLFCVRDCYGIIHSGSISRNWYWCKNSKN